MSSFICCFWWFLLGLLLGWLLNWLLSNGLRKDNDGSGGGSSNAHTAYSAPVAPVARAAASMPAGIDIAAAAAAGFSIQGAEDIIIIEGIGPKIKELFNQSGVNTFAQVSKMSVAEMNAILEKGGPRFKLANPGSWAEQARLADSNEWSALKKLQDELYAGVAPASEDKA